MDAVYAAATVVCAQVLAVTVQSMHSCAAADQLCMSFLAETLPVFKLVYFVFYKMHLT